MFHLFPGARVLTKTIDPKKMEKISWFDKEDEALLDVAAPSADFTKSDSIPHR